MTDAITQIELLLKKGQEFTYKNFATFTRDASISYPESYSAEWIAWTSRVKKIIQMSASKESAAGQVLTVATGIALLGNGEDKFEQSRGMFLSALNLTLTALQDDTFHELGDSGTTAPRNFSNTVFVVHGHDEQAKTELEVLLSEMGFDSVVLHRKPDEGQTLIEKFEKHSDVGFAFILLTPDDLISRIEHDLSSGEKRTTEARARQNVIFEFGYFLGKLGRHRVCCLHRGDVVLPSDLHGLVYKKYEKKIEEVAYSIIKELQAAGYQVSVRQRK